MIVRANRRRNAAAAVEAGLVLSVTLLLLFGIFEYCRFIFVVQLAENAAREGARFAISRTGDGTTLAEVQEYVRDRMAGREHDLVGFTVLVENVYPETGEPVPGTSWNDAPFGGAILVRVSGTYAPLLPSLIHTPVSFPLQATSMMTSEAN